MTFTIEPMITKGRWELGDLARRLDRADRDGRAPRSSSTRILVTDDGADILTLV